MILKNSICQSLLKFSLQLTLKCGMVNIIDITT